MPTKTKRRSATTKTARTTKPARRAKPRAHAKKSPTLPRASAATSDASAGHEMNLLRAWSSSRYSHR